MRLNSRTPQRLGSLLLCGLGLIASAQAQQDAGAATASDAASTVQVRGFTVTGATLIDDARIQAALQSWKGNRSLAELRQAAQAVQTLYTDAGFGAVVAYLPPQPVSDGIVTIAVVEGRIAHVKVNGATREGEQHVRAALPSLVEGATPRVRTIDTELLIANENPARQMSVLLGPGGNTGEVEATVKVEEQPAQRWTFGVDNTGNDSTGHWRLNAAWQNADLSGRDDVLNLLLQTSPTAADRVQVLVAGYRLPQPQWLAAFDLYAAYSNAEAGIQPTPAGGLSFAGKGHIFGARGTRYLQRVGDFDQRVALSLEYRDYINDCSIADLPQGACGPAGESVTVQPLAIEYSAQSGGPTATSFNVALAHNLALGGAHGDAVDFENARPGAKPQYTVLRAGAASRVPLFEDWSLAGRINLQTTSDPLVAGEQFGLGGAASVRGYLEREVAGDRGVLASVELTTPRITLTSLGGADLRLLAFVDGGEVTNVDHTACAGTEDRCRLSSAGFGLRLGAPNWQIRLDLGRAFEDAVTTKSGDWRAHFAASISF
jgi:hemolysin activation/secretion protein